jgi:hypothetical protein
MGWLSHPRYVRVRDELVLHLKADSYRFRKLKHVAFLCGGANSARRDTLKAYLRKTHTDFLIFYAEPIWAEIAKQGTTALQMEAELASLADVVVIIVESPGTFTELGAFSLSDALRPKLLPIADQEHEHSDSFIRTGPLAWVDADSLFKPTIYVKLKTILESADQIAERLARIPRAKPTKIADLSADRKHLLFFICDLVSVICPADIETISYFVEAICGVQRAQVEQLVGLARAMGLVFSFVGESNSAPFYFRQRDDLASPYHHRHLLDLPSERAKHLAALEAIQDARAALLLMGERAS